MEFKKDLDLVGKIAAHSVMSGKYKDKDGNIKEILPVGPGNSLDFDQFREDIGAFGGGSGGSTDPNHPTAGADYYAGSLADGEITERYLLYQRDESVAEQTGSQTITLLRDVGSKFNMAGEGATFLIHLQRTAMTKGAKGAVTDIELNYDTKNVAKNGYFTTTSPYPIYIKASDLVTKKTLSIPINGIGESLSGKNVKAPQLNVTFNGNGTMTLTSVTGYDNDGNSTGATGANYEIVVDVVATFSVQNAVAQMPSSINLFTGLASDVVLAGAYRFYENTMDGIEVTLDDYLYGPSGDIYIDQLGISKIFRIEKKDLILNNEYSIPYVHQPVVDTSKTYPIVALGTGKPISYLHTKSGNSSLYLEGETSNSIKIGEGSLSINISRALCLDFQGKWANVGQYIAKIIKVTTYKN